MDRCAVKPAEDKWHRRLSAVLSLAMADRMLRRPKRSIDRELQEYPFFSLH